MKLRPHSIDFLPLEFNASRGKGLLHQVYTKTGATTGGTIRFNSLMGAMQTAKLFRSSPKTDKKNRAAGLLYRMHGTSKALFSSSLKGYSAL
jgi:hypothetical protein